MINNIENLTTILESARLGALHDETALADLIDNTLDKTFRAVGRYKKDINCDIKIVSEDMPEINLVVGSTGAGKTAIVHAMITNHVFKDAHSFATIECFDQVFIGSTTHNRKLNDVFIIESILCSQKQRDLLVKLRESGAYIRMFFVSTESPLINTVRAAKQSILKKSKCDVRKVWERYFKSLAGAIALAPCVNEVFLIDNSIDMKPPRVLAQVLRCEEIIHYTDDIPKWAYLFLSQIEQNRTNLK